MPLELGPRGVRFEGKDLELGAFGLRIRALVKKDKEAGGKGIRLMVRIRPGMTIGGTEAFLSLVQQAGVRAVDFL
jgi:hypothetical protein